MRIRVADIVGDAAVTQAEGRTVFDLAVAGLASGDDVTFDFEGVSVFAGPFFNQAVGALLGRFSVETLRAKVRFEALPGHAAETLVRVIENAKRFHGVSDG